MHARSRVHYSLLPFQPHPFPQDESKLLIFCLVTLLLAGTHNGQPQKILKNRVGMTGLKKNLRMCFAHGTCKFKTKSLYNYNTYVKGNNNSAGNIESFLLLYCLTPLYLQSLAV